MVCGRDNEDFAVVFASGPPESDPMTSPSWIAPLPVFVLSALLSLSLAACGDDMNDDDAGEDETTEDEGEDEHGDTGGASEMCLSGEAWIGGDVESPNMHPGADCLDCHQSRDEAEEVVLGGTVFDALDEPTDCFGVAGVTLELTDADGVVHEVVSNAAGNFVVYAPTVIATPYTVKLGRLGASWRRDTEVRATIGRVLGAHQYTTRGDIHALSRTGRV